MTDWVDQLLEKFRSGQAPTEDELLAAISRAALDRKAMKADLELVTKERDAAVAARDSAVATKTEIALWMGRIVAAFLQRDADKLARVIAGYTVQHVKFINVDPVSPTCH